MDGFGAMLAFEVDGGAEAAQAVAERVRVIVHATSLGGVETLIERRSRYAGEATPEALLRVSVGIEARRGPVGGPLTAALGAADAATARPRSPASRAGSRPPSAARPARAPPR